MEGCFQGPALCTVIWAPQLFLAVARQPRGGSSRAISNAPPTPGPFPFCCLLSAYCNVGLRKTFVSALLLDCLRSGQIKKRFSIESWKSPDKTYLVAPAKTLRTALKRYGENRRLGLFLIFVKMLWASLCLSWCWLWAVICWGMSFVSLVSLGLLSWRVLVDFVNSKIHLPNEQLTNTMQHSLVCLT